MDKELFELCKEVYKRTRWYEVEDFYVKSFTKKDEFNNAVWEIESYKSYAEYMSREDFAQSNTVPLYTSDYLLEKLLLVSYSIQIYRRVDGLIDLQWMPEKPMYNDVVSDSTLKALLKLTIALHEAGELK